MKKLFRVFRNAIFKRKGKLSQRTTWQLSSYISVIGVLMWIGASANIAMSFVYILKASDLGAFVSMTMLVSLFYLIFTSLASNFDLMGKLASKR